MPVGGRVAGKVGIYSSVRDGVSMSGINEEIIWVSIGMSVIIAILITMALCYLAREKCRKRQENNLRRPIPLGVPTGGPRREYYINV